MAHSSLTLTCLLFIWDLSLRLYITFYDFSCLRSKGQSWLSANRLHTDKHRHLPPCVIYTNTFKCVVILSHVCDSLIMIYVESAAEADCNPHNCLLTNIYYHPTLSEHPQHVCTRLHISGSSTTDACCSFLCSCRIQSTKTDTYVKPSVYICQFLLWHKSSMMSGPIQHACQYCPL